MHSQFRLKNGVKLTILFGFFGSFASLVISTCPSYAGPTMASAPVVTVVNLSNQNLDNVPVTFGLPFREGAVPNENTVLAYLQGKPIPIQMNIKARNADGSARHAVITLSIPRILAGASEKVVLRAMSKHMDTTSNALDLSALLKTDFDATVNVKIDDVIWHLDARNLLEIANKNDSCRPYGRSCSLWLAGPLISEWVVGGPLLNPQGQPQKHLAAYFAIRAYGPTPIKRVRVDVIVENDWAYVPGPKNETYDADILVDGKVVDHIDNLDHYRQARWHKIFWWGLPAPLYAQLDSTYLQDSLAVPRYADVQPTDKFLNSVRQTCAPMQRCDQTKHMSNVGAQAAIGPLPRWTSVYVVDPTYRAFRWMLANDDALGAYGVHFRDRQTGQPVSVITHPCATLIPAAEIHRCPEGVHADDSFPRCTLDCQSPLAPNESHHPSPAYVAYLVTGDWYYLEELKFWADWIIFQQNPAYRDFSRGLIERNELRGQAWALRTLGYAAYILPDNDPFKHYFNRVVENNIKWYNQNYTDNPEANRLHIIINGYAVGYPNNGQRRTGTAIWQQSFFAWAVGNLADLGFKGAQRLQNWVSQFQIGLMTDPDYCWIMASAYELQVRDSQDAPFYDSLNEAYENTFPQFKNVPCNSDKMAKILTRPHSYFKYSKDVMVGYPFSPTGFVANFQIGLAADASASVPRAVKAWEIFAKRRVQPNYSNAPQFALLPRKFSH